LRIAILQLLLPAIGLFLVPLSFILTIFFAWVYASSRMSPRSATVNCPV